MAMIISIDNNRDVDTDRELSSEERHVLQKLLCYRAIVDSVDDFRLRKEKAYSVGWNNSGPIKESPALALIVQQMEKDLVKQLQSEKDN